MHKILWSKNHAYIIEIFDSVAEQYCIVHFAGDDKPFKTEKTVVRPQLDNHGRWVYHRTFSQAVKEYQETHEETVKAYYDSIRK